MSTIKLIALSVAVAFLVVASLIRDFFFNPRQFWRDMREANGEDS